MREDIGICLTQKNLGLGFWWEDEAFTKSQNPKELSDAVDSMRKLLEDAKQLRSVDQHQEPDQTLTTPAISNVFLQNTDTEIMSSSKDAVNNQQLDSDDHDHQDVKNDDIKKNDHVLLGCGNQEPDQTLNL
ncbi:unnamed protein product [Arabis nemorensis]|uniref:Uncharacterized protein n=1 Tax=Arabis nemorensis TaxID=586526 RepID=A0A565B4W6_9BRAS|nr:unnamed protein product [Arabis nemorensis]